jgi:integrase
MALYRRGRIWYADFYVRGKRVQESTGTANRRRAEKIYASRISEVERGEFVKPVRITISDFGQQYLEYAKTNKRSWMRDQGVMKHVNKFFGTAVLSEIGSLSIEKYKMERIQSVSPATVNREIALLKHMFNLAEQWGIYRGPNPGRSVKFLAENNLQFRFLTEAEEEVLLQACSPDLQDLVVFAINTGLRLGEILNLKWQEVDFERNILKTLVRKNRRMLEVPLNKRASVVLRGRSSLRKCDYVFYNPKTGDKFSRNIWWTLKKACRKAGLGGITWHTFRHTFASRLTRAGVDIVTVKELLGHSSISITMRYAHNNHASKARAVELLGTGDKVVTAAAPENTSAP